METRSVFKHTNLIFFQKNKTPIQFLETSKDHA